MALAVGGQVPAGPTSPAGTTRPFPAWKALRRGRPGSARRAREGPRGQCCRNPDTTRGGHRRSAGRGAPPVPVRREHHVVIATGRGHRPRRHDRGPRMHSEGPALRCASSLEASLASLCEQPDVFREHDPSRPRFRHHLEHLLDGIPPADEQLAAPVAQGAAQIVQGLGQEGPTVLGSQMAGGKGGVDQTGGTTVAPDRADRPQRRMVVHPEVTVRGRRSSARYPAILVININLRAGACGPPLVRSRPVGGGWLPWSP